MAESWKRPVLIGIKADLLEQAKSLDLDLPAIAEDAITAAICKATHSAERDTALSMIEPSPQSRRSAICRPSEPFPLQEG